MIWTIQLQQFLMILIEYIIQEHRKYWNEDFFFLVHHKFKMDQIVVCLLIQTLLYIPYINYNKANKFLCYSKHNYITIYHKHRHKKWGL